MGLYTFPSADTLAYAAHRTPEFMRPAVVPYASIFEGFLDPDDCDAIIDSLGKLEVYGVGGCGAMTRECVADSTLDPIEHFARAMNALYWKYDLDAGQHSWLQTYGPGGKYQRHMDGSPGQTRKLTAVAMLTDAGSYQGGDLRLYAYPKSILVPRTRGTIVVFQHNIEHEVSPVSGGWRQTINMGFWGPPFR